MTPDEFAASALGDSAPPAEATPALQALWHAKRGEWSRAHEIAQDVSTPDGSWVHAHLHRIEGDESNARYWYARAGRPHAKSSLADEWREIATALLER